MLLSLSLSLPLWLSGEGFSCVDAPLRMIPAPIPIDALSETLIKGVKENVSGVEGSMLRERMLFEILLGWRKLHMDCVQYCWKLPRWTDVVSDMVF